MKSPGCTYNLFHLNGLRNVFIDFNTFCLKGLSLKIILEQPMNFNLKLKTFYCKLIPKVLSYFISNCYYLARFNEEILSN